MTLKQVLIPRQAGEIALPEVKLHWWNTQTQTEQTSQISGLVLHVKPSEEAALPTVPTLSTTTPNSSPVNDAGYWPYLTLLFALLWLATSLFTWWQWQHTKHPQQVGSNHSEPSSAYQILLQAIEQQDLLAISQAMRIWQSQIILDQDEQQRLTALLYPLQQACYSEQPQTPDFSELKHWIMVKQKQQCKRTRQQEAELPQL